MRWRTLSAVSSLALVAACGPHGESSSVAPPREMAAWCSFQGIRLGVELGVVAGGTTCERVGTILGAYLQAYESRWADVAEMQHWTVRVVADRPTQGAQAGKFFAGETFWDSRIIDLYQGSLSVLPHEIHHVALGPPSADHQGWCPFGDWEAREGILHELDYLGCSG
ncbi:MAG TPA: hypothetical protein VFI53_10575 [Myxococcaceae bacterium]|nr:hypothetical protein [Myxococcaceae bacterium]